MREEIEARFRANLDRVRALLQLYEVEGTRGRGRRPVATVDLLRAAVVFLHATMEDILRSVLSWRWPQTTAGEHLRDIPFALGSGDRKDKITLSDLLRHRGSTVEDVIRSSIETHLARSNFNNVGEVKTALERSGLDPALVNQDAPQLAAMMARRHQIVHRADRHDGAGSGHHAAASLGKDTVRAWVDSVETLCGAVFAAL